MKAPKPPAHLGDAGRKLWREVLADYDIADAAGRELLAVACAASDRLRAAQKAIAEHGELVIDRYGAPKLNPACSLEKESRAGLIAALKSIGVTQPPAGVQ
jgi:P27 family predicted phage terminase small subunit